jgi:ABC-2 type transport system permease protein
MTVFGVAMVLRMVADSGPSTRWLLWTTPFGWVERMRPLTENDLGPLVVAVVAIAVVLAAALWLSARRDVGAGVLAGHDVGEARSFGLGSPPALMVRLGLPSLVGWWAGAAVTGLAFGFLAKVAVGDVPRSIEDNLAGFGFEGPFVRQFLGVGFLFVAPIVGLLATSQLGAAAGDEAGGRTAQVLAQPVHRRTLLLGRLAISGVGIVAAGLLAGVATWLGATTQDVDPGFGRLLAAGANLVPTALLVLALGALVFALRPAWATRSVYAVVIGSLLVETFGSLIDGLEPLTRVSLYHYMALAPAADPDLGAVATTVALSLAVAVAALAVDRRRDVASP